MNKKSLTTDKGWYSRLEVEGQQLLTVKQACYEMLMIMSMGWDYVSEQRPPTGLLFIVQVIYEHE
jgi:hypothetical protein